MLKTPELAACVRFFFTLRYRFYSGYNAAAANMENLSSDIDSENALENDLENDSENDFGPMVDLSTLSEGKRQMWMCDLREEEQNEDALLALLLPALPKLQCVDIMIPHDAKYVPRMFERAGKNIKPFDSQPNFTCLTRIQNI